MAINQTSYKNDFAKSRYERIALQVAKGRGAELKEYAKLHDKSVNSLILEALWKCYRLDLKTPVDRPEE